MGIYTFLGLDFLVCNAVSFFFYIIYFIGQSVYSLKYIANLQSINEKHPLLNYIMCISDVKNKGWNWVEIVKRVQTLYTMSRF